MKNELPPLERQTAHSPPPPHNGGIAWLSVLAGFLAFVIAWGPASGCGSFQDYYETQLLTQSSPSKISWIGTTNVFLLIGTGVCSGPLFDRGYGRFMVCGGCVTVIFGMMMLSLSQKYYQVMLSHGICVGLGAGITYIPMLALVNCNFVGAKRAIANGVVASGGSAGGVIFPIVFLRLLPRLGFPWTVRILGFLQLGCFFTILPIIFLVPFPESTKTRSLIHWDALRQPAFSCFALFTFLVHIAYFVPMVFVPVYAIQQLNLSRETGMYLLAGLNGGSGLGRIGSSLVVHKVGPTNMLLLAASVCGITQLAWISVANLAGLAVFSVMFGIFSGIIIATLPLVVVHPLISPRCGVIGTRMGMVWFVGGVGILIGSPIGGSLTSETAVNHFLGLQVFSGVVMLASLVFLSVTVAIFQRHRESVG
ncbi:MFS general substrate transporter [Aspergillus steynii IBT 23096]|uniref:MFS general substrate transporter n=1 Tax=Aspergillus steynii IBT 23096 TaxID=1392250 RepID=A0A2I2GHU3_9EURO|nr:MFS general substrate transporter [Aspergillus steynii IBT 23096]PLB52452.1 MFS general substrate transporter [Aspergillus steynii IBT 23096]